MTDKIKQKLAFLHKAEYKKLRKIPPQEEIVFSQGTSEIQINTDLLKYMLDNETPVLFEDDIWGFNRTLCKNTVGKMGNKRYTNGMGNITINYPYVLDKGMDEILVQIRTKLATCPQEKREWYTALEKSVTASLAFADKYRDYAKQQGATQLYQALCQVPHKSAQSFYQACVFVKFVHFTLRCNRNTHLTFGGFDKYMYPFFQADLEKGVTEEQLFETLEDFFVTINIDSDTYFGGQQGDNGMSMVLGGRDVDGNDMYNKLSEMCLKASTELCLIDPKINLRVDKNTPIERFELATELTKKGLGFPQYCNDDVVIPGLIKLGYQPEDAHNYTVAACWELIVPYNAYDIPNIDKVNFPLAVEKAVNNHLSNCSSFDEFLTAVKSCIQQECHTVAKRMATETWPISPYLSVFVDGCVECGLDVGKGGAKYNNYGAHGVGISTAADCIAAVKKAVFDDKHCTAAQLLQAIQDNFDEHNQLRNYLVNCPKMGNNDDYVDCYASMIMDIFANVFAQYKNIYGGVLRAGTGSALEYIWSAAEVGTTPDGRRAGTPFGSSFSPSPLARSRGPLSCIQSFTKHDMTNVINGGPLTMEIHDNTFRNPDGTKKVAALVKAFIERGGHQLQLNSVNRDVLLDAQQHPERHKNLIVRVWGWSGYFNELDVEYQDHIISRTEYSV